jgi:hypothetical protein
LCCISLALRCFSWLGRRVGLPKRAFAALTGLCCLDWLVLSYLILLFSFELKLHSLAVSYILWLGHCVELHFAGVELLSLIYAAFH